MPASSNKQRISEAMEAMANGDTSPFGALMHPQMMWTVSGSNSWSGQYAGLDVIRKELFAPLFANFTTPYVNRPINIVAEGDFVVVECRAHAETRSGKDYDQAYCYVIRMAEGKIISLTEYMDTELVATALSTRL